MAFTEIDEKLLVRAYQAGDERAFDTIVRTQYQALYAHALRRLSQHEAAEDAVQDTLLRAYRALPNLDGDLALRAWLHRILTNVCHDEGNRRRREHGLVEKVGALPEETESDIADEAVLHDTVRVMAEALKDLPENYREALVLRYVDGLSFREVAEATHTTEENARARVHRGRAALHKIMSRLAVMAAFIIPGLRRTQTGPSEPATASSVTDQAVHLGTQLTSHAMQAAPAVSRLAEVASTVPSGTKSALAATAVAAVAAVSVPVAVHQVNEARRPERPAPAVAAPLPTSTSTAPAGEAPATSAPSTTQAPITLPPSQADPFPEAEVKLAPVAPRVAPQQPSTTTTVAPSGEVAERISASVKVAALQVTGESPQYDLAGAAELRGDETFERADLAGRLWVYPDGESRADEITLTFEDGESLVLRLKGTVIATNESDGEATYQVTGTYVLPGGASFELPESGDVTAEIKIRADGSGSLLFALDGLEATS